MAYTSTDFRTKKALKEAVAAGEYVRVAYHSEAPRASMNGTVYLEGPHYPKPHTWYAQAEVKDGLVVKVK